MATLPPYCKCWICGVLLEWEIGRKVPAGWFCPTDWVQKSHECPPGALEVWVARASRE